MGEFADMEYDRLLLSGLDDFGDCVVDSTLEDRFARDIWTTRDGDTIHITEMSMKHLLNCIGWITQQGPDCVFGFGERWMPKLEQELSNRRNTNRG